MPTFNVNIFGTAHKNHIQQLQDSGYFLFNLNVLQVDFGNLVLSSFDMFLEFYAYPFNPLGGIDLKVPNQGGQQLKIGTSIFGSVNSSGNYLGERKRTRRPQIIHLTTLLF